jgi:hypothetical protein
MSRFNQNGGFFWSGGCDKNNKEFLNAIKEGRLDFAMQMLKRNLVTDISVTDSHGNTVLHVLSKKADPACIVLLQILSRSKDLKSIMNSQNNNGDTPLHIAVKNGNNEMADMLDSMGVDKDIANNEGDVVYSTEEHLSSPVIHIVEQRMSGNNTPLAELARVMMEISKSQNKSSSNRRQESRQPEKVAETDDFLEQLSKTYHQPPSQTGGRSIYGSRLLRHVMPDYNELSRDRGAPRKPFDPEATKLHDQTVVKIMEVMQVPNDEAKVIKAALWKIAVLDNKEADNLTQSKKMLDMVSRSFISGIKDKIEDARRRVAERAEQKAKRGDKKKIVRKPREKKSAVSSDSATSSTPEKKPRKKAAPRKKKSAATESLSASTESSD